MSDTDRFNTRPLTGPRAKTAPLRDFDDNGSALWVVEFRIVGTPHIIRAPLDKTFTIGRAEPERGYSPEIDLTPYDAQGMGVSRKHARLSAHDNRVLIQDLGSANGTHINGERLEVLVDRKLEHGDVIKMGHLELQVHFVVKPLNDDQVQVGSETGVLVPKLSNNDALLIIEENEDVARVLGRTAKQAGFNVTAVVTVEDAIREIDRNPPRYVITELIFEEGDGLSLVRYLRHKPECHTTPIMIVTNATAGFTVGQALAQGADLILAKPVALEELVKGLEKMTQPTA